MTLSFKDFLIITADKRGDNVAKIIKKRIIFKHDLVAAEVKYYHECYLSFIKSTIEGKVGHPEDNNVTLTMENIFFYIRENNDDCQFTKTELKGVLYIGPKRKWYSRKM